jgi:hypothetical protein
LETAVFNLDDDDESLLVQFVVTIPDGLAYNADVDPLNLLCANETRVGIPLLLLPTVDLL